MENQVVPGLVSKTNNITVTLLIGLLSVYSFFLPILFVPNLASNYVEFPKLVFTVFVALLSLLILIVHFIIKKSLVLPLKVISLSFLFVVVLLVASSLITESSFLVAFNGKTSQILAFICILFTSLVILKNKSQLLVLPFLLSTTFASLIQIIGFFNLFPSDFLLSRYVNPTGDILSLLSLSIVTIPSLVYLIVYLHKNKLHFIKLSVSLIVFIQLLSLVFIIIDLLNGKNSLKILPLSYGLSIMLDTMKNLKTAFLGLGPDNFILAFSNFRSGGLNFTPLWQQRYNVSSNEVLTLLSNYGLLFIGSLVWLFGVLYGFRKEGIVMKKWGLFQVSQLSFFLSLISLFLFPSYIVIYGILFLSLAAIVNTEDEGWIFKNPIIIGLVSLLTVIFVGFWGFFSVRYVLAESAFSDSIKYAKALKGNETYKSQFDAIQYFPNNEKYHLAYSRTNILLAKLTLKNGNITDDQKVQVSQLVSQSIKSAKVAVSLNPKNVVYWENLANIYKQLIGFADKADQWAIVSYVQAIRLEPSNPVLHFELGSVLYSLERYDDAADQFKQAIQLKGDYANAYYNLSYTYKKLNRLELAYNAMVNVVGLTDKQSDDFAKASGELQELQKSLPVEQKVSVPVKNANGDSQLTVPSKPETVKEPVKFDEETLKTLQPPTLGGEKISTKSAIPVTKVPEATASGVVKK